MMEKIVARAEANTRAKQRARLEQIAGTLRERGYSPRIEAERMTWRGKRLVRDWLADPLLRFAGRMSR